jgi:hypothetical protein
MVSKARLGGELAAMVPEAKEQWRDNGGGAVPSAPGVRLTRHPQTGAVRQPRLLYGNLLEMQWLATSHFS